MLEDNKLYAPRLIEDVCPACGRYMELITKKIDRSPTTRWLRCPSCGVLMPNKPSSSEDRWEALQRINNQI